MRGPAKTTPNGYQHQDLSGSQQQTMSLQKQGSHDPGDHVHALGNAVAVKQSLRTVVHSLDEVGRRNAGNEDTLAVHWESLIEVGAVYRSGRQCTHANLQ